MIKKLKEIVFSKTAPNINTLWLRPYPDGTSKLFNYNGGKWKSISGDSNISESDVIQLPSAIGYIGIYSTSENIIGAFGGESNVLDLINKLKVVKNKILLIPYNEESSSDTIVVTSYTYTELTNTLTLIYKNLQVQLIGGENVLGKCISNYPSIGISPIVGSAGIEPKTAFTSNREPINIIYSRSIVKLPDTSTTTHYIHLGSSNRELRYFKPSYLIEYFVFYEDTINIPDQGGLHTRFIQIPSTTNNYGVHVELLTDSTGSYKVAVYDSTSKLKDKELYIIVKFAGTLK